VGCTHVHYKKMVEKKNGDMHGRRGKQKNILLPAGEMGCVAGEGKKKNLLPARLLHVGGGKK
jgi:hypothetical protein